MAPPKGLRVTTLKPRRDPSQKAPHVKHAHLFVKPRPFDERFEQHPYTKRQIPSVNKVNSFIQDIRDALEQKKNPIKARPKPCPKPTITETASIRQDDPLGLKTREAMTAKIITNYDKSRVSKQAPKQVPKALSFSTLLQQIDNLGQHEQRK